MNSRLFTLDHLVAAIRGMDVTEHPASEAVSLRPDACKLDHLGPLFGFVADELSKVGGRADKRCASEVSQPRLDFGIGVARVEGCLMLIDDFRWCCLRCAYAEPDACLLPSH